jgi:hypothetical protein
VFLHVLVMAFINAYGYPMQESRPQDFVRTLEQLQHREAGPKLVERLGRLGLDRHPAMVSVREAVEQTASR